MKYIWNKQLTDKKNFEICWFLFYVIIFTLIFSHFVLFLDTSSVLFFVQNLPFKLTSDSRLFINFLFPPALYPTLYSNIIFIIIFELSLSLSLSVYYPSSFLSSPQFSHECFSFSDVLMALPRPPISPVVLLNSTITNTEKEKHSWENCVEEKNEEG